MQMWPDLIGKAKEGGVDVIETYTFWNGHEPVRGQVRGFLLVIYFQSYYCMLFSNYIS